MNKEQVLKEFKENILPYLKYKDRNAKIQAWNDWTDKLCKDEVITTEQYNNWKNPF